MKTEATDERIVVGVDGSPSSRRAVRWALDEARSRRLPLEAAFAWEIPALAYGAPGYAPPPREQLKSDGLRVIDEVLSETCGEGVEVRRRVYDGAPTVVLRELGSAPGVSLVVVGSRGRGGVSELFLGSVSHYLTHHCAAPVVVVPAPDPAAPTSTRRDRIVVGIDGSPGADRALHWAAAEARVRQAVLEVVAAWSVVDTVWPVEVHTAMPPAEQFARSMQAMVDVRVARYVDPDVKTERTVVEGLPAEVLLDRAAGSDLLVVGSRGLGRAREVLLGSVSHACTHRSPVPIAVIRSSDTAPDDATSGAAVADDHGG